VNKHPLANCTGCPYKDRPYVSSEFNPGATYNVVGESPGRDEAFNTHTPFTGPSGDLLWKTMAQAGVKRSQCNVLNVIACAPPEADAPEKQQQFAPKGQYDVDQTRATKDAETVASEKAQAAQCCSGRLHDELSCTTGNILLLGRIAQYALLPELEGAKNTRLCRWVEHNGRNYIYTWHPAHVLRAPVEARTMMNGIQKYVRVPPGRKLPPVPEHHIVVSPGHLHGLCSLWEQRRALQLCIDTETDQIDWQNDDILCMGIYDGINIYVVPKYAFDSFKYGLPVWDEWYKALHRFFSIDAVWIMQNGKYDQRFLRGQYGLPARCTWDTMLGHYAWDERKGTHDLKGLCAFFFDVEDWELQMAEWIGTSHAHNARYSIIPADNLHAYVAQDVFYDWHLKQGLEKLLKREGLLEWPLLNLLMPANEVLLEAEIFGAYVDTEALDELWVQWLLWQWDVRDEIEAMTNGLVDNPASTVQVSHYVYDILGLKLQRHLPKKSRCTDDEVIAQLFVELEEAGKKALHAYEFLVTLRQFRRIQKMRGSYVEQIKNFMDEHRRVHPEFLVHGTETGRISARNPAIQTIPRPNDREAGQMGSHIRNLFIAPPGCKLVNVDYSQCELRFAAHVSGDTFLREAYIAGRDLHSEVTKGVFGEDYTDEQRQRIKVFNFQFLYGAKPEAKSYARGESIPLDVAKRFVDGYKATMGGLLVWRNNQERLMHSQHFVKSIFGRRRMLPVITIGNREEARKVSINAPIQGGASDLTLLAAIDIYNDPWMRAKDVHVLLPMHDSILLQVPTEYADEVADRAKQVFVDVAARYIKDVPFKADAKVGDRWGDVR